MSSLLLFLPYVEPINEITLITDTPQTIVISIHHPRIIFETSISGLIKINISYVDLFVDKLNPILQNGEFTRHFEQNVKKNGYYIIEMSSPLLGNVQINGDGGNTINLVLVVMATIMKVLVWTKDNLI